MSDLNMEAVVIQTRLGNLYKVRLHVGDTTYMDERMLSPDTEACNALIDNMCMTIGRKVSEDLYRILERQAQTNDKPPVRNAFKVLK